MSLQNTPRVGLLGSHVYIIPRCSSRKDLHPSECFCRDLVRLKNSPEIYLLLWIDCLVSINNALILSNETFTRFPGNIVKLFDRHGTNKGVHILLRALYSSNISVFTDNRTASFVESSFFFPLCVLHRQFHNCHNSNSDTKL